MVQTKGLPLTCLERDKKQNHLSGKCDRFSSDRKNILQTLSSDSLVHTCFSNELVLDKILQRTCNVSIELCTLNEYSHDKLALWWHEFLQTPNQSTGLVVSSIDDTAHSFGGRLNFPFFPGTTFYRESLEHVSHKVYSQSHISTLPQTGFCKQFDP